VTLTSPTTLFADRASAGRALAARLEAYAGPGTLVLGIPRGGLVIAAEVARHLGSPLDVLVVCKLGAPHDRDVAIGAVTANGGRLLNLNAIRRWRVSTPYVNAITQVQRGRALHRNAWLRGFLPAAPITGHTVLLVDDGMISGASMRAAIAAVRRRLPARVIAAVPVARPAARRVVAPDVDALLCLEDLPAGRSLAECYGAFPPLDDATMRRLLLDYTGTVSTAQGARSSSRNGTSRPAFVGPAG
jgi:predicted phosphoribosyltransferase